VLFWNFTFADSFTLRPRRFVQNNTMPYLILFAIILSCLQKGNLFRIKEDVWSDPFIEIFINRSQRLKANDPHTHLRTPPCRSKPTQVSHLFPLQVTQVRSTNGWYCPQQRLLRKVLNPFTFYIRWRERYTWEQSKGHLHWH